MSVGERLGLQQELIHLWLEQTTDYAVVFLDNDGNIVGAGGGIESTLGYMRDDLVGKRLSDLFTIEDRGMGVDQHELLVAQTDGRAMDDRWHQRKGGGPVWISGAVTAVHDRDGQPAGMVKIMRDRTDLRAEVQSLRNRVLALTRAGESEAAVRATLAHEVRNVLAPLQNATEIMRHTARDDRVKAPIAIIDRQIATLQRLVDDMMDVARHQMGKLDLDIRELELQAVIAGVVDARRDQAAARGLELVVLLPPVPIAIEADPGRLEQVLANLLGNALKYTPARGRISISATVEGADAVIRLADSGIGIAADMLPRIFELFTQEPAAHAMAAEGLGIGLALVKRLVDAHGGIVEVRSPGRGQGSEFIVRWPLRQPRSGLLRQAGA